MAMHHCIEGIYHAKQETDIVRDTATSVIGDHRFISSRLNGTFTGVDSLTPFISFICVNGGTVLDRKLDMNVDLSSAQMDRRSLMTLVVSFVATSRVDRVITRHDSYALNPCHSRNAYGE